MSEAIQPGAQEAISVAMKRISQDFYRAVKSVHITPEDVAMYQARKQAAEDIARLIVAEAERPFRELCGRAALSMLTDKGMLPVQFCGVYGDLKKATTDEWRKLLLEREAQKPAPGPAREGGKA